FYLDEEPDYRKIAYFSLEIGIRPEIPTYSGGLGILAGDTLKSFADLGEPVVGITLLYEKGYFHQEIKQGEQKEVPVNWKKEDHLHRLHTKISIRLEDRDIIIQPWLYMVEGYGGKKVPIIFLDSNIEQNSEEDRELTAYLYGGDKRYRLLQEAILGIGGVNILQTLGHSIKKYHMNEGHSALLTLELMNKSNHNLEEVRESCIFTTHTPVPAGHDSFDIGLAKNVLKDFYDIESLHEDNMIDSEGELNMTYLALHHSSYVNGVAKKHGEVSRKMFPGHSIDAITNGVHAGTWVSEHMGEVFDKYIPSWRKDQYTIRYGMRIPKEEIWNAHLEAKKELIHFVNKHTKKELDPEVFTIGFARRAATYKRADLIFSDIKRLKSINKKTGKIQIIFGGKAHPNDQGGKDIIKHIIDCVDELKDEIKIVYLDNYEMYRGKLMTSGCDLWLNNPLRPREASGTSGMKAALNGVPQFSVLDGWWIEGHVEDFTGWSIGPMPNDVEEENDQEEDINDLYTKLEKKILPTFYRDRERWMEIMRHCIAFNGSFFNTQRMVDQYTSIYFK
ncbi:MAG: alpha-glucan family phosphorylase, partial [Candidatus Woesearchaeota archaeon]